MTDPEETHTAARSSDIVTVTDPDILHAVCDDDFVTAAVTEEAAAKGTQSTNNNDELRNNTDDLVQQLRRSEDNFMAQFEELVNNVFQKRTSASPANKPP